MVSFYHGTFPLRLNLFEFYWIDIKVVMRPGWCHVIMQVGFGWSHWRCMIRWGPLVPWYFSVSWIYLNFMASQRFRDMVYVIFNEAPLVPWYHENSITSNGWCMIEWGALLVPWGSEFVLKSDNISYYNLLAETYTCLGDIISSQSREIKIEKRWKKWFFNI